MSRVAINPSKMQGRELDLQFVDMPSEVEQAAREVIATVVFSLPNWLRSLAITFKSDDASCLASVNVDHKYRCATIRIAPAWLELDAQHRRRVILHEIIHIWTAPAHRCLEEVVKRFIPADPGSLREIAEHDVDSAFEIIAEDLACMCDSVMAHGTDRVAIPKPR